MRTSPTLRRYAKKRLSARGCAYDNVPLGVEKHIEQQCQNHSSHSGQESQEVNPWKTRKQGKIQQQKRPHQHPMDKSMASVRRMPGAHDGCRPRPKHLSKDLCHYALDLVQPHRNI